MSSPNALEVSNLSKVYRLYERPADRLKELLLHRRYHQDFVALKDVSFTLRRGCTLGVLGDNGAGKSTLLQLVVGSHKPTSGSVTTNGAVMGLLALGLGFHHEFTGLQNIFFYGDVLGVSRSMIQSRQEQIIAFAELEEFIDQPIKTYSTGMRMRLAFALVANLDPDILVVDEALAVGDMHFQKKCIDRMVELKERGCTILFCSHSLYMVQLFCDQVIWLRRGRVQMLGTPEEVIPAYEAYQMGRKSPSRDAGGKPAEKPQPGAPGSAGETDAAPLEQPVYPVRITALELLTSQPMKRGDEMVVKVCTESGSDELPFHVTLSLKMVTGYGVFATGTHLKGEPPLRGSRREILVRYPDIPLLGGVYTLHARVFDEQGMVIYHEKVLQDVEVSKETPELGVCHLENRWEVT